MLAFAFVVIYTFLVFPENPSGVGFSFSSQPRGRDIGAAFPARVTKGLNAARWDLVSRWICGGGSAVVDLRWWIFGGGYLAVDVSGGGYIRRCMYSTVDKFGGGYLQVDVSGGGYIRRWIYSAVDICGGGYLQRWISAAVDVCAGYLRWWI